MTCTYDELLTLITQRGVHAEFGDAGEGWGIEQNPHELATFLARMTELGVTSCLEIGTGYKGGLSRFLAADMGWQVTSVDVEDYGNRFKGVHYVVLDSSGRMKCAQIYDLVFIDGDHTFDKVWVDYVHYECCAVKIVAFHDIAGLRKCEGAKLFWDTKPAPSLKGKTSGEIIAPDKQAGIGWIEL